MKMGIRMPIALVEMQRPWVHQRAGRGQAAHLLNDSTPDTLEPDSPSLFYLNPPGMGQQSLLRLSSQQLEGCII